LALFGLVWPSAIGGTIAIVVVETVFFFERKSPRAFPEKRRQEKAMSEYRGPIVATALVLSVVFVQRRWSVASRANLQTIRHHDRNSDCDSAINLLPLSQLFAPFSERSSRTQRCLLVGMDKQCSVVVCPALQSRPSVRVRRIKYDHRRAFFFRRLHYDQERQRD